MLGLAKAVCKGHTTKTMAREISRPCSLFVATLFASGCYNAPVDAIFGRPGMDASQSSDAPETGSETQPGQGDAATSSPPPIPDSSAPSLPVGCEAGAGVEQEPNDTMQSATGFSQNAVCGEVTGSDVDFLRIEPMNASVSRIDVEGAGTSGVLNVWILLDQIEITNGSATATPGSSVTTQPTQPGDLVVKIAASSGDPARYIVRVTP